MHELLCLCAAFLVASLEPKSPRNSTRRARSQRIERTEPHQVLEAFDSALRYVANNGNPSQRIPCAGIIGIERDRPLNQRPATIIFAAEIGQQVTASLQNESIFVCQCHPGVCKLNRFGAYLGSQ